MSKRINRTLSLAVGTCLLGTLSGYSVADARGNPFSMSELSGGYMLAGHEGVCGEGKCGGSRQAGSAGNAGNSAKTGAEGKCGEGKCGAGKAANEAVCGIYKVGSAHQDDGKVSEGVCGGHAPVEMLCGDPR